MIIRRKDDASVWYSYANRPEVPQARDRLEVVRAAVAGKQPPDLVRVMASQGGPAEVPQRIKTTPAMTR